MEALQETLNRPNLGLEKSSDINRSSRIVIPRRREVPQRDEYVPRKKQNTNKALAWAGIGFGIASLLGLVYLHKSNQNLLEVFKKAFARNSEDPLGGKMQLVFEDLSKAPKLDDLALPKELTTTVQTVVDDIKWADLLKKKGGEPIRSLLLYGPSGTGKTTFARAIANSIENAKLVSLDLTKMNSAYHGETQKNLLGLVEQICDYADKNPQQKVFVLLDEIDSVMMEDKSTSAKLTNDILNEFKRCFTERLGKRDNIICIGTTNVPATGASYKGKRLNDEMMGRFGDKIPVGRPTAEQIKRTLVQRYKGEYACNELQDANAKELDLISQFLADKHISFRELKEISKRAAHIHASDKQVPLADFVQAICDRKANIIPDQIEANAHIQGRELVKTEADAIKEAFDGSFKNLKDALGLGRKAA